LAQAAQEAGTTAPGGQTGTVATVANGAVRIADAAGHNSSAAPTIGSGYVPDQVAVATGWCLFDLGRPRQAADVLQRELDRIPADAPRARARFGARLALALAGCGEPEQACAVADEVLDACGRIQSATVRVDLRGLSRDLNRWPGHPAVGRTRLRLAEVLRA
ncbi:MAG: XRE family transcriptional regulator, partial [Catenulispora sp.]|nr:XRE family transcriptional regulator [Catenulispora sp.]